MKPGRELDALVAEKVMGWTPYQEDIPDPFTEGTYTSWDDDKGRSHMIPPNYSTDIAAAMEMEAKINLLTGKMLAKLRPGEWCIMQQRDGTLYFEHHGESPAHAICLAALKAVGA